MVSLPATPTKIHESNIEKIIRLEAEGERQIAASTRYFGAIGSFAGTPAFIGGQATIVGLWIATNSGLIPGLQSF